LTEKDLSIGKRKSEHLKIVAEKDVSYIKSSLLECVHLIHCALPEVDFEKIRTETEFFGKLLRAPLMITSMTGGTEYARELNRSLAEISEAKGIAFAVGSQRVIYRHPETKKDFAVRKWIPNGVLLGNIGAAELVNYPINRVKDLISSIEADGICVHLNPAQEMVQSEGNRNYTGQLDAITELMEILDGRVLIKETGAGIDPYTLERLKKAGVKYIDISGAGGTSWTKVEMYRANDEKIKRAGETFSDWGLPTAFSIYAARMIMSDDVSVIASGGINSGLDVAKSIALGADVGGFARPILKAYLDGGIKKASLFVESLIYELKTAMLLTGVDNLKGLKNVPRVYTGELRQWLNSYGWLGEKED